MEFGILGPLEVSADGRPVALGGARPRAVFAVLALHANQPVSAERLALALWDEDAPPSAVKTIQVYVARLRSARGPRGVGHHAGGLLPAGASGGARRPSTSNARWPTVARRSRTDARRTRPPSCVER